MIVYTVIRLLLFVNGQCGVDPNLTYLLLQKSVIPKFTSSFFDVHWVPLQIFSLHFKGHDMAAGKVIGYIRVSTHNQSAERQLEGIPLDKTFVDQASGKDVRRPQLAALLDYVRDGDKVFVHSMDRLARNLDDLRKIVQELTKQEVHIHFVKENLTFTGEDSPLSHLLLSVMGAFAEFERSLIRERQREGIALAKKRGAYKGRKKCLTLEKISYLRQRVARGDMKSKIARDMGISRETLYQYLKSQEATRVRVQ